MKTVRYILAALLLAALIAVPAFAEPVPTTAFSDLTNPADPVQTIEAVTANADEIITAVDGEIITTIEGEEAAATVVITAAATEPPTEAATVPEDFLYSSLYGAEAKLTPLEYIQANAISLAALAVGALALLLAIIALVKNRQPGIRKMKDFF